MPDEYGHLYEQEERLIKAATRGTPPNYRMRGGWECCHNCTCPRLDNHCGKGCYDDGELFWINQNCPLHGNVKNHV